MSESGGRGVLTIRRIEGLADGIFAFAMTLLVMFLALPDAPDARAASVGQLLSGQSHKFYNWAVSFILLAVFWVIHHEQFHSISRTDRVHVWINVFMLMLVTLMPFSTDLVGDFPGNVEAQLFFGANILVLGLLFLANWAYATRGRRLVEDHTSAGFVSLMMWQSMIGPAVAVIAMLAALVFPRWALYTYLLIPAILALRWFRRR